MASENEIKRRHKASVEWLAQIYEPPEQRKQKDEDPENEKNTTGKKGHEITKARLDYMALRVRDPLRSLTEVDREAGISGGRGSALRKALEKEGLIKVHRIKTGRRGGQVRLAELTEKGYELLAGYKVPVKRPAGRGSYEHRWWQSVIHDFLEKRRFRPKIEQEIAGKAVDVGVIHGERRIAIEVLNEGLDKELSNVAKDLEAGWDEVWLCAVKKETLDKLKEKVLEAFGNELMESGRVRLKKLSEFLTDEIGEQGPTAREREEDVK